MIYPVCRWCGPSRCDDIVEEHYTIHYYRDGWWCSAGQAPASPVTWDQCPPGPVAQPTASHDCWPPLRPLLTPGSCLPTVEANTLSLALQADYYIDTRC